MADLRSLHLVEPDWLQSHLADTSVRIVDMRGYVKVQTQPEGSQTADYLGAKDEYERAHIPGAVYLDWTRDIVDLDDRVPAQVAGSDKIAVVFGAAGIGDNTLVVAYDNHPASQFATRLWWVLKYYGHDAVRVLNGGLARWNAEGRPLSSEAPSIEPAHFTPRVRPELRRTAEQMLPLIGDPYACIVDARDEGQYSGSTRRGPRGGHIPGAIHLPRESLIGPDGCFKREQELALELVKAGVTEGKSVAAYCNGGVAATTVLFALSMLGRQDWSNYDGSWNEWSKREDVPIE